MKRYGIIIFLFSLFNLVSNSLDVYFNKLIDLYEEEHGVVTRKPSQILNYKRTNKLSFQESLELYQSAVKRRNSKYIISSLERLYLTAKDSQVAEVVLYKLIQAYFKYNKESSCFNVADQFIKLFPGSRGIYDVQFFYIKAGYNTILSEYHDATTTERTLSFARMMYDNNLSKKEDFDCLVNIINNLYRILILRELYILDHYYDKWFYTFDQSTVLSCLIRLEALRVIFMQMEVYPELSLNSSIIPLLKKIEAVFLKYSIILPAGETFEEDREKLLDIIKTNRSNLREDILSIVRELKKIKKR